MSIFFLLFSLLALETANEGPLLASDQAAMCLNGPSENCICPPPVAEYAGPACMPKFRGTVLPINTALAVIMTGRSYHEGCPVPLADLRVITFSHFSFDGLIYDGQVVVSAKVADEILNIFRELYEMRFPLEKARLIDYYAASDSLSMADNNTSAFNCRRVTGGKGWSEHTFGAAIDINPLQNPYVTASRYEPLASEKFLNRKKRQKGMILPGDPVVKVFAKYGWKWGGNWKNIKDYQHFSKSGR